MDLCGRHLLTQPGSSSGVSGKLVVSLSIYRGAGGPGRPCQCPVYAQSQHAAWTLSPRPPAPPLQAMPWAATHGLAAHGTLDKGAGAQRPEKNKMQKQPKTQCVYVCSKRRSPTPRRGPPRPGQETPHQDPTLRASCVLWSRPGCQLHLTDPRESVELRPPAAGFAQDTVVHRRFREQELHLDQGPPSTSSPRSLGRTEQDSAGLTLQPP